MQRITAFDFDETITTCDTLPLLLKHSFGRLRWWWGVVCCLPWIVLYELGVLDGGPAKERLLSHFVKGMHYDDFKQMCEAFAGRYRAGHTRVEALRAIDDALAHNHRVLVVTASMPEWVEPWLQRPGVTVIGTEPEVDAHCRLTGRFATPNCNGSEKWRRIVAAVPEVERQQLAAAYGDSRGDLAMLGHAQAAYYRSFDTPTDVKTLPGKPHAMIFPLMLVALVAYQLLGVFFGMDVADAGFYLTFYDNIFTHPESVEYNFMYYLSGVIGGTAQSLFPSMGMLGMRLLGVMFNTLCAVALYLALRRHIDFWAMALGFTLVVASFIAPPYTLSYDLCTVLFYSAAIAVLWKGVNGGRPAAFVTAGVLLGLNVLVRIPNVLGLSLAVVPLLKAVVSARRAGSSIAWRQPLLQSAVMVAGAFAAIGMVILLMPSAHKHAFTNVLADLQAIASDTSGTASHTTGQMIMTQLRFYGTELWTAIKLAVPIAAYAVAHHRRAAHPWACMAVKVAAIALFVYFTARMHPLQPVWLMALSGCIAVMAADRGRSITWAALAGAMMMLIMPLGSDGAYNNGTIIAWAAAPVAAVWWKERTRAPFVLTLIVVCAVRMVTGGAYFDGGSLTAKQHTVASPRATAIFTTAQRATVLNTVLSGIAPHIEPGTTLMAYGSIPTLNYLTGTHPYLGCSWPEQLSAAMLKAKLDKASVAELPPVLRQKFNTLGPEWGTPSEQYLTDYGAQNAYQDNSKLQVLNDFLEKNLYKVVYEDTHFVLYKSSLPPTENNVK